MLLLEGDLMIETGRIFWLLIQSAIPEGFIPRGDDDDDELERDAV